jgi:[NiFe] hydrogenase assembly HybE family chaperone
LNVICNDKLTIGLEKYYRQVMETRMQGLPVLNPRLEVQAVGFREWQGHCLGVMITPWFMNLMLLPGEGEGWERLWPGGKQIHPMPSGPYEFVAGEDEGIGQHQICSLFSPMFEFADQATAVMTAESVLEAVMLEENRDTLSTREREIERIWRGEPAEDESQADLAQSNEPGQTLTEKLEQPMSRRNLLRGALLREAE